MKITYYDDFFPEEIYKELINTAKYLLRNGAMSFSTNAYWDHGIVKDSFPVLIHHVYKDSDLFKKVHDIVEKRTNLFVSDHEIMLYFWTRFAYIPWHADKSYGGALTVYLNEEWHEDFGGYFLYEDNKKDIRAILPRRNFGLLQQGGLRHCTTPVNYDGGMRITLQVFLENKK